MARLTLALFSIVLFTSIVDCSILRAEDVGTKDVPLPREDVDSNLPTKEELEAVPATGPVEFNNVIPNEKKCAKIGEFCMNHGDCCSNSCLGYMKRCVS